MDSYLLTAASIAPFAALSGVALVGLAFSSLRWLIRGF